MMFFCHELQPEQTFESTVPTQTSQRALAESER